MRLLAPKLLVSLARLRFRLPSIRPGTDQGDRRSWKHGSSVEFSDYREYGPGDDFRHIDWNIYTRLDRLFVKLFIEEQNQYVNVLVDTSASMQQGNPSKIEYAARLAAAFSYVALSGGDHTRLGSASTELAWRTPRRRGRRQAHEIFRAVRDLKTGGLTQLSKALQTFGGVRERADLTILISDLFDPDWMQAVATLGYRAERSVLIHLLAPEDWNPWLIGEYELNDVESGDRILIELDASAMAVYRQRALNWIEEIRAHAATCGVACYHLDTTRPIDDFILNSLRRGGLLQ